MEAILQLRRRYAFPVWIRFVGELVTGVTNGMLAPFLILYINQKMGGDLFTSTLIVGMGPLTEVLFTILGGGVTDRIGRKVTINLALFSQALVMFGFMFAHTIIGFASLYILNGVCRSLYIPAARAQIVDVTAEHIRSEVFAVLSTIGSIGFTFGPALGLWVYATHPQLIFGFEAGALLLYGLIYLTFVKETAPPKEPRAIKEKTDHPHEGLPNFFSHYRSVLILMVLMLPISFFHAQTETNYRFYLEHLFTNYLSVLAILSTVQSILMLTLEIILVKWSEKLSMRQIVVLSYSCYILVAFIYGFSTALWPLVVAQLFLTMGQTIGLNHLQRYVSQIAPAHERGLYFALFGTHWDLSRMIGPSVGSLILVHLGGPVLFSVAAVFLMAGVVGQSVFLSNHGGG